jgi:hypothetical protein
MNMLPNLFILYVLFFRIYLIVKDNNDFTKWGLYVLSFQFQEDAFL